MPKDRYGADYLDVPLEHIVGEIKKKHPNEVIPISEIILGSGLTKREIFLSYTEGDFPMPIANKLKTKIPGPFWMSWEHTEWYLLVGNAGKVTYGFDWMNKNEVHGFIKRIGKLVRRLVFEDQVLIVFDKKRGCPEDSVAIVGASND